MKLVKGTDQLKTKNTDITDEKAEEGEAEEEEGRLVVRVQQQQLRLQLKQRR